MLRRLRSPLFENQPVRRLDLDDAWAALVSGELIGVAAEPAPFDSRRGVSSSW
jgi:hypothetical protein